MTTVLALAALHLASVSLAPLGGRAQVEQEPNDTRWTANTTLGPAPMIIQGTCSNTDGYNDYDWFEFAVRQSGLVRFTNTNASTGAVRIVVQVHHDYLFEAVTLQPGESHLFNITWLPQFYDIGGQFQPGYFFFYNQKLGPTPYEIRIESVTGTIHGFGNAPGAPVLPCNVGPPWNFCDVPTTLWVDPPVKPGYKYVMTSGALFTAILDFPPGFPPVTVHANGQNLGQFVNGQSCVFVPPVSEFSVTGVRRRSPKDPMAYPLKIDFNQETASFRMEVLGF